MATQLKQTDFHPIPFHQPKPTIRVAFRAGAAQTAIKAHMADKPAAVRESTLDELGGGAVTPDQPWFVATATFDAACTSLSAKGLTDEQVDRLTDVQTRAAEAVLALPVSTVGDVATKLRVAMCLNTMVDNDTLAGIRADLVRLAGSAAPCRENGTLLHAFQTYRDVLSELRASPDNLPETVLTPLYARMDRADDLLKTEPALTTLGVAMKLKRAFSGMNVERWSDEAVFDGPSPEFARGLDLADHYEQMLWSAIEDLDRINAAPTMTPADQHREWLRERNELIARLNADGPETDEEIAVGIGELNQIDNRILGTAATTSDGLLVQMVLVTQLGAEGHEVAETTAAELVACASKLVGLGSLAGASRDIEEQVA